MLIGDEKGEAGRDLGQGWDPSATHLFVPVLAREQLGLVVNAGIGPGAGQGGIVCQAKHLEMRGSRLQLHQRSSQVLTMRDVMPLP